MGMNYYVVGITPTVRKPIHIGKSSMGWKFLFHRVDAWENYIDDKPLNTAKQWYTFLRENEKFIFVLNEEDEVIDVEWLIDFIEKKQSIENPEEFVYSDNIDGYRFTGDEFS